MIKNRLSSAQRLSAQRCRTAMLVSAAAFGLGLALAGCSDGESRLLSFERAPSQDQQIDDLERARNRGAITQGEYFEERTRLLDGSSLSIK